MPSLSVVILVWIIRAPHISWTQKVHVSNVIAEAGQSHEVICSLKPTEFSLTYEWTVGEILLQRRGSNVYRFSEVLTSDARNDYACIVHRTNGQEFSLNWTFTVFLPSGVWDYTPSSNVVFIGLRFTMTFSVSLGDIDAKLREVAIVGPNTSFSLLHHNTVADRVYMTASGPFEVDLAFRPLSAGDEGDYECVGHIVPHPPNKYAFAGTYRRNVSLQVPAPRLTVSINTTDHYQFKTIAPFNSTWLKCEASAAVMGVAIPLLWIMAIYQVQGDSAMVILDSEIQTYSSLMFTETKVSFSQGGHFTYKCSVRADITPATDVIEEAASINIFVQGPRRPYLPEDLKVYSVTHNEATVEWKVQTVVFSSEVYIVEYRTANSKYIQSQPISEKKFTLYQLIPNCNYYVVVVASNSIGNTSSLISHFRTTYPSDATTNKFEEMVDKGLHATTIILIFAVLITVLVLLICQSKATLSKVEPKDLYSRELLAEGTMERNKESVPRSANTHDSLESMKIRRTQTMSPTSRQDRAEDIMKTTRSQHNSDRCSPHHSSQATPLDQLQGWDQNQSYNYYKNLAQSSRVSWNQNQPMPVHGSSHFLVRDERKANASKSSTPVLVIPTPDTSKLKSASRASRLSSMAVEKQNSREEGTTESKVEAAKSREERLGNRKIESNIHSSLEAVAGHHKLLGHDTTTPHLSSRDFLSSPGTVSKEIPENEFSSSTHENVAKISSNRLHGGVAEVEVPESGIDSLHNEPGRSDRDEPSSPTSHESGMVFQKSSGLRKKLLVHETAAAAHSLQTSPVSMPGEVGMEESSLEELHSVADLGSSDVEQVKMPTRDSFKQVDGAAFSSIISQYRSVGELGELEGEIGSGKGSGNGSGSEVKVENSEQWPWMSN